MIAQRTTSRRRAPSAFTLLEVILALAILGFALATLGQAVGRSHENASRVAQESELMLIASSVMDEVLSGVRALTAVSGEALPDPDDAQQSRALIDVELGVGPLEGLVAVRVVARPPESADTNSMAGAVELVRWMVDPSLAEPSTAEANL